MTVLKIVFVGQCEVFVCLDFVHFFFFLLAAKLIGPLTGVSSLKNVDFSHTYPFKETKKFNLEYYNQIQKYIYLQKFTQDFEIPGQDKNINKPFLA